MYKVFGKEFELETRMFLFFIILSVEKNSTKYLHVFYKYETDLDGHITHLFFSKNSSIALSRYFSTVFIIDCTYKTNRFRMPLMNVVGITSCNQTFFSCFTFWKEEKEADYIWALKNFKALFNEWNPTSKLGCSLAIWGFAMPI